MAHSGQEVEELYWKLDTSIWDANHQIKRAKKDSSHTKLCQCILCRHRDSIRTFELPWPIPCASENLVDYADTAHILFASSGLHPLTEPEVFALPTTSREPAKSTVLSIPFFSPPFCPQHKPASATRAVLMTCRINFIPFIPFILFVLSIRGYGTSS